MYSRLYEPLLRGDSNAFYSFVKAKTGDCNKIKSLTCPVSGQSLEDPVDIANELNMYFKSVFNIQEDPYLVKSEIPSNIVIEVDGVKGLVSGLKSGKASGPDGNGKRELIMDLEEIANILAQIFQYSVDSCTPPAIWKLANVTPNHKGGSRSCASNYRPVSLTCICCKMLEHIILGNMSERIMKFWFPSSMVLEKGCRAPLNCSLPLRV